MGEGDGAGGGSRTRTLLPVPDFESGASAISPPRRRNSVYNRAGLKNQASTELQWTAGYFFSFIGLSVGREVAVAGGGALRTDA